MPNQLELAGAQKTKPTKSVPLHVNRFSVGLWTQRNVLRSAGGWAEERYFGPRGDALVAGTNIEVSNRLTLVRRPGLSQFIPSRVITLSTYEEV